MPDGASSLGLLPDAAFATDEHDIVTDWNGEAERLLGIARERALGSRFADLALSSGESNWRSTAAAGVAETGRWRGRVAIAAPGRTERLLDWVIGRRPEGGTIEVVRELADVPGASHGATEALESEAFRILFEESPVLLAIIDNTTRKYVAVNRRYCEVRGLSPEQALGKTEDELGTPPGLLASIRERISADGTAQGEAPLRGGSDPRIGYYSLRLVRAGDRELVLVSAQDITRQKRAEAALHDKSERYLEAVSSISAVIWSCNVDEDFHLTDLMLTPVADRILGLPEGTVSKDWDKFLSYVHPDDVEHLLRSQRRSVRNPGVVTTFEYRVVTADGTLRWIRSTGQTRVTADGRRRIFGVAEDVTQQKEAEKERQKLEEQLRQAQKMEAIGNLAGGVAHDFNNLLTVISGNVSLALMSLKPDEPVRAYLKDVAEAGARAASVTRQLLAFSRRQLIEPKVLPISELVAEMRRMLERLLGEDVKLHTYLSHDIGLVRVDPGQVEQILVNLCVNARHAMPDGGELTIETSQVVLDEAYCEVHPDCRPGDYVLLAVSDTGCGMSPEIRARVFEPFFTTKAKGQGTGMGLAMVYGAVKQSKGSIEVYSEPGRGTVFKIYFPCVAGVPETFQRPEQPSDFPQGGTETILVVEDDSAVRSFAERVLTKLGYRVVAESCGADAVRAVLERRGRIDLLMTDVVLPDMNGRMLADRIQELSPSAGILFTSGYTQNVIVHHGVLDEGIQFLGKPYTARSLAQRVREMLDQR